MTFNGIGQSDNLVYRRLRPIGAFHLYLSRLGLAVIFFRKVKLAIARIQVRSVSIAYDGNYQSFRRAGIANGYLAAFERLQMLEDIVGDAINDVVRVWSIFVALMMLFGLGQILTNGGEKYSLALMVVPPLSELVALMVLMPLYFTLDREWKTLSSLLP